MGSIYRDILRLRYIVKANHFWSEGYSLAGKVGQKGNASAVQQQLAGGEKDVSVGRRKIPSQSNGEVTMGPRALLVGSGHRGVMP